jgi:rare lipoprotein A
MFLDWLMAWCKISLKMMNVANNKRYRACILVLALCLAAYSALSAKEKIIQIHPHATVGIASFYGAKFQGRRTASGELFNNLEMTAAHRTLPFGTQLRVTNLRNGKSVVVRVNDRGPHLRGRIIDLSKAAAKRIGITRTGIARVKLEIL